VEPLGPMVSMINLPQNAFEKRSPGQYTVVCY